MSLLIVSFLAGVLTILAPCVLPLLPIILGSSIEDSNDKWKPYIIIASLSFSIIVFSLLLKASTIFIGVDPIVWKLFSGLILIIFGIITIFPNLWKNISVKLGLSDKSNKKLNKSSHKEGIIGTILVGFSLGPVFSSCSPTYAIILAVILPVSFLTGIINLLAYVLGLASVLLLISLLGQKFIKKIKWISSEKGLFKKILGILFLLVGLAIISGYDKIIEAKIITSGYFENILNIEESIIDKSGINKKEEKIIEGTNNNIITTKVEQNLLSFGLKTDTGKISIDFDDILNGGPGKDGIPAINNPKFLEIDTAQDKISFLENDSRGISVEIDGDARFYPYGILVWHEIVNDIIGNKKISVTFCPLCGSAIVYDREIDGDEVLFGVSGLLYESNLLMYDDKTESLWSQSLGQSVVGKYLGKELTYIKSNLITFQEFINKYPKGKVLSDKTGFLRRYGNIPYGDYDESDDLYFPVSNTDIRFSKKELFYIVNDGTESLAFLLKDLKKEGIGKVIIGNTTYVATYNDGIIDVKKGNIILKGYYEMWFSWINHNESNRNIWFVSE